VVDVTFLTRLKKVTKKGRPRALPLENPLFAPSVAPFHSAKAALKGFVQQNLAFTA
jgi:hypothetical protein